MMRFRRCKGANDKLAELKDEILEQIWTAREMGKSNLNEILERVENHHHISEALSELEKDQMVKKTGDNIEFLEKGEERARGIIRRHRLAETLLSTVFEMPDEVIHSQACCLEHERVLSPAATESICTFLGHPPTCPHGKPIPPGPCCSRFAREVKPLVIPLTEGEPGEIYRIVFMAPKTHQGFDRLANLGVIAGSEIRLHQKKPSYLIMAGETEVALDEEVAKAIYVKKII
jgi:DtxR family Mn-dependent transcriptional regulator